jgi:putative oxidoreductase
MKSNLVSRIALGLYGIVMAVFGLNHLMHASDIAGYVPEFLPAHLFFVYLTGLAFLLAGISFLLNIKIKISGYLLGLLLVIIVCTIHLPHLLKGDPSALTMVLKDTGLAAAAFFIGGSGL